MKYHLLKGTAAAGIALTAGQHEFQMQKSIVDKLIIALRSTGGVTPTEAQLKEIKLKLRWQGEGFDTELRDISLYALAFIGDARGGYVRDWTNTDLSDTNIVDHIGVDLTRAGVLMGQLIVPTTVANCTFHIAELEDGSRPPTYRYRELTTSGKAKFTNTLKVFSYDETGNEIEMQVGEDKPKAFPFIVGRVLAAEEAKIEAETEFCRLFSSPAPQTVEFNAGGQLTMFSMEMP